MTKFIMMVGLSGSGKSYLAKELSRKHDAIIMSSDEVREALYGDASVQKDHKKVFEIVHERTIEHLSNGISVINDATNLSYKFRINLLQKLAKLNVEKIVWVVATPIEECLANNEKRDRKVPEKVVRGMMRSFHVPVYSEGWDKIGILWNNRKDLSNYHGQRMLNDLMAFDQDNEHHSFTLGGHMKSAGDSLDRMVQGNTALVMATYLHDIGKVETKVFHTMKGEATENAHYYGHEFVGSYKSLFVLKNWRYPNDICLDVARLIRFHMRPYFAKTDKAKGKLRRQIGEELYEDLLILHEADVAAH